MIFQFHFILRVIITPIILGLFIILSLKVSAENHKYLDSWGKPGYTVESQNSSKVLINYSISEFANKAIVINGETFQNLELPGNFLPGNAGEPNLPGSGRYLAIPQGAEATINIVSYRSETFNNMNLAPAFRIPWATENDQLEFTKNEAFYSTNKFFPEEPVVLSKVELIRGVDVVMLGITPFHYNPVTQQLIVFHDLKIEVNFTGGNGHFGNDKLRSRWWDPMLSDMLLNYESLPELNYNKSFPSSKETGCEYLIVTPNNAEFQQWADSIKKFRTTQGILTKVVTLGEVGGNSPVIIEDYINNAYNTWDIVPAACLLLGDYGTNASNTIISPLYDNYCVSDNIYGDVDNNNLPDIVFARITAQDENQLQVMVTKFLNYERTPPTDPNFYNHPVTSVGWQTDSWFQVCSEVIGGYWHEVQGKEPVRINEIFSGTPGTEWSTAPNTTTVVNYFGPTPGGLGYIPELPSELGGWTGGTAETINDAINAGAFMIQHRDHGTEFGWTQPSYSSIDVNELLNTDLTFIWSIDNLTGKFNYSTEVFAEKLHRYTHKDENSACFGINAASEITYDFVSDVYVWGAFDNMWPDFMPEYGSTPEPRGVLPAFACASGKYFLEQSGWPNNTENKAVTYHLFHHHGDAFTTVFSEVPQVLTVSHESFLYMGETTFEVTADADALIALSVNGELIGTATGTGSPVSINIPVQAPPDQIMVTVTKQNYLRYTGFAEVLPATGPYVVPFGVAINDGSGNGNGIMETSESILASITVKNIGVEDATNVMVSIATTDPYVTITDDNENYGTILSGATAVVPDGFAWETAGNIPDLHNVIFEMTATDGTLTWTTSISVTGHAPSIEFGTLLIDDYIGNYNGRLEPGETAFLIFPTANNGSFIATGAIASLSCLSTYVNLVNTTFDFNDIGAGLMEEAMFNVTVSANAPAGAYVEFLYEVTSGGYFQQAIFPTIISMVVEDWETGDMSQFDWTTGGSSDWTITFENPYQGSFCSKSGTLDHNQSNFLSVQYEVLGEDSLSFWYKVSSEAGYDLLKFYIDDVELSSWSGELGWERASFMIPVGPHTFKWEYIKDENLSSGEDCAWIDFIVFPVSVYEASFASNETDICEGETVNFYDQSPLNTISWEWYFEGGSPETSTLQNPDIQYLTLGVFDVSLTVSNGTESNTLLLEDYITVSALPGTAPAPTGPEDVCVSAGNTIYSTAGLSGISTYIWVLQPVAAGFVAGTGLSSTVYWEDEFLGDATLKVSGTNDCGNGLFSNPINITRYIPEVTLAPFAWVCVGWPAFELEGGLPEGGTYSGPGIENGWFNPAVAGVGTHTITYTYSDPNNCVNFATETILVDPCPGINERADESEISIYPNPTSGTITIGLKKEFENAEVIVVNTLNKVVYSEAFKKLIRNAVKIDLSNLPKGVYFIKFKTKEIEFTEKIILL